MSQDPAPHASSPTGFVSLTSLKTFSEGQDHGSSGPRFLRESTTVLVQSLGVDEDDVTPAATLLGDLGAESIDLLDIVFRLEREFAITIPRGELFIEPDLPGRGGLRAGRPGDRRGPRRPACPDALRRPERTWSATGGWTTSTDLFTVDLLVRYVTWKLESGRDTAEGAAATAATLDPASGHPSQARRPDR